MKWAIYAVLMITMTEKTELVYEVEFNMQLPGQYSSLQICEAAIPEAVDNYRSSLRPAPGRSYEVIQPVCQSAGPNSRD